jgi:hypothetical protein
MVTRGALGPIRELEAFLELQNHCSAGPCDKVTEADRAINPKTPKPVEKSDVWYYVHCDSATGEVVYSLP